MLTGFLFYIKPNNNYTFILCRLALRITNDNGSSEVYVCSLTYRALYVNIG